MKKINQKTHLEVMTDKLRASKIAGGEAAKKALAIEKKRNSKVSELEKEIEEYKEKLKESQNGKENIQVIDKRIMVKKHLSVYMNGIEYDKLNNFIEKNKQDKNINLKPSTAMRLILNAFDINTELDKALETMKNNNLQGKMKGLKI